MALDIDRFAHVESALQRWDPRFKIFSMGILVFGIALLETIPLAFVALALAVGFLIAARLPYHFVSNGVQFVAVFLIPFFIVMPLSYPGEPAFHILGLPFAWEGLRLATLIVAKSLAIVMTAYAIFGTTRFDVAMIALQRLKVPKVFVQMLLFTYRYIFVFIAEMKRMDVGMQARGFIKQPNLYTLKVLGNFVGTLLVRSFERTERVYKAMLSKGYQGEFHTLRQFHAVPRDTGKAVLILAATAILLAVDFGGVFSTAEQGWL